MEFSRCRPSRGLRSFARRNLAWMVAIGGLAWPTGELSAQGPTTVQLPTVHEFSVSTSVLVPDRGGMVLGGVGRSSQSSVSRGVPGASNIPGAGRMLGNRAIGRDTESATASAHVWVHDLAEMDEAVRASAAARGRTTDSDIDRKAAFLSKHVGRPSAAATAARPTSTRSTSQPSSPISSTPPQTSASVRAKTSRSPAGPR